MMDDLIDRKSLIDKAIMMNFPSGQHCVVKMQDIRNLPSVEITNEMAIEHLQESGWMIEHDRIMTTSSYNQGYKDGQEALAKHFELCIEEIKAEVKTMAESWENVDYDGLMKAIEIIDKHIANMRGDNK